LQGFPEFRTVSKPLGRVDDIAHAVSFFASEAASFITGQRLVVDGGRGLGD
jgi:3-oxoacyl-[acyl-carrier protein] reductase